MGITAYSLAISIVFYNLALIVVFILRRSPGFRARHAVSLLAFITVLGVVRLVLPIDFDAAYVVRSYKIIPVVEAFLGRPLAGPFTYGHLLLTLWAVGSLVMIIKDVRLQWRFDRYLQSIDFIDKPELLEIAAEYGSGFAVLISPQINMPFTSGILHPVIYLPDVELSDEEWRMVLRHEITHICSQDNPKKLFFLAVEALFWWNPVAHFSGTEINTLIELRCDAKVAVEMNERERYEYATLLKKLMNLHNPHKTPDPVSALAGEESQMNQRIMALIHPISSNRPRLIARFLLILVFLFSYFIIVQPIRFPTNEMLINDVNHIDLISNSDALLIEGSYIIFENGKYHLYYNDRLIGSMFEDELFGASENTIPILGGK